MLLLYNNKTLKQQPFFPTIESPSLLVSLSLRLLMKCMLIAEPIESEAAASDKLSIVICARWKKKKKKKKSCNEGSQMQTVDPALFFYTGW